MFEQYAICSLHVLTRSDEREKQEQLIKSVEGFVVVQFCPERLSQCLLNLTYIHGRDIAKSMPVHGTNKSAPIIMWTHRRAARSKLTVHALLVRRREGAICMKQ